MCGLTTLMLVCTDTVVSAANLPPKAPAVLYHYEYILYRQAAEINPNISELNGIILPELENFICASLFQHANISFQYL